jgi:hypothetical protein
MLNGELLPVEMVHVESSNVESIGYDANLHRAYVNFLNGSRGYYKGVPQESFETLVHASSIGSHLHRYFRDAYEWVSLPTFEELKKAAEPLVAFLQKYYDPMCQVVVTTGEVTVMRLEMGGGYEIYDKPEEK